MDELFQGRGLGRLLMAVGLVVALVGFAGWMYLILSAATSVGDGDPSPAGARSRRSGSASRREWSPSAPSPSAG